MAYDNKRETVNWCFSGGAAGADFVFGNCAKEVGHNVTHFSFRGHKTPCTENIVLLNELQLHSADDMLFEANFYLKRKWPTRSTYVNNLLERNYYQIKESQRIYALSSFEENGQVKGGTGWAVLMGILLDIPEVYIYDVSTDNWNSFVCFDKRYNVIDWTPIHYPPFPVNKYTGIGMRDLPDNGKDAIMKLYNL